MDGSSGSTVNEETRLRKVVNFAKRHFFFLNVVVLNLACLIGMGIFVKDKTTKEVTMIFNGVLLGCAILSLFIPRGYFARIPEQTRKRRPYRSQSPSSGEQTPEEHDGKLEETVEDTKVKVEDGKKNEGVVPINPIPGSENLKDSPSVESAVSNVATGSSNSLEEESDKTDSHPTGEGRTAF